MKKTIIFIIFLSILLILFFQTGYIYAQQSTNILIKELVYDDFPKIDIYFSVFDELGLPVKDLAIEDIEIQENKKVIEDFSLESIINTTSPTYITLLIDNSGSMKGTPLEEAQAAAVDFVKSLKDMDEVKVFVFNDEVEYIQDFTTDKNLLINSINDIETTGTKTVLNLAVYNAAIDLEEKPIGNRAIVLLTDGKDEGASIAIEDAINKAKENKIPIYSVGSGENFNEDSNNYDEEAHEALSRFSILTGGKFFIASEEKELETSFEKISDILKYQYHLSYTSNLLKDGESYDIDILVASAEITVKDSRTIITPMFKINASLDEPEEGIEILELTSITPKIEITPDIYKVEDEIEKVEYYLDTDSNLIKEINNSPYTLDFDPEGLDYGEHKLVVKIYDSIGRMQELETIIIIPVSSDYKILIYWLLGGFIGLIIIATIVVILIKRKKRKLKESFAFSSAGDSDHSIKEGDIVTEKGADKTWPNVEDGSETGSFTGDTYKEEEGEKIGTETIIKMPEEFMPNAWVVNVKGSHEGKEYSIPPEEIPDKRKVTMGRNSYHDIVIDDELASRDHAYIVIEKNKYKIGDMGSSNGTFLNNKKISSPKVLNDGDKISIGDTELVFKCILFEKSKKEKTTKKKSDKHKKRSE